MEKSQGGSGILLGGVPVVKPGKVVIIGGGVVGLNATKMAISLGANVTVMDISAKKMAYLDDIFFGKLKTIMTTS